MISGNWRCSGGVRETNFERVNHLATLDDGDADTGGCLSFDTTPVLERDRQVWQDIAQGLDHIAKTLLPRGMESKKPRAKAAERGKAGAVIPIGGLHSGLPVKFAPNGGAVPGDRIVGIIMPGEGITIYPIQSPALKEFEEEPERWLDVKWDIDESTPQRFPARLFVQNVNEPGSLAQIAGVIAEHDGNIDNINMSRRSPDFTELTIDLEVYDLKHLSAIIAQLRAKDVVAHVERVNG